MKTRRTRSLKSWVAAVAALPVMIGLSVGCGRSQARNTQAPVVYQGYSAGYSANPMVVTSRPAYANTAQPSSARPVNPGAYPSADTTVTVVAHSRGAVNGVDDSLGYERLSSGDNVTVVTYVHHYPEPIESFPTIQWSNRLYYNIHGNFVFWDPFWNSWAYYWGPPQPLIGMWNMSYPWMAYSWGTGFYGPGWYWGGVGTWGFHSLGVMPAPLASNTANTNFSRRPNPQGRPGGTVANSRPSYAPGQSPRPAHSARPSGNSRPIANGRPTGLARPSHASRATSSVTRIRPGQAPILNHNPQGGRATGAARTTTTTRVPSPAAVVAARPSRPSYRQSNDRRRVFSTPSPRPARGNVPPQASHRATRGPSINPSTRSRATYAPSRSTGRARWHSSPRPSARPSYRRNFSSPSRPSARPSYRPSRPSFSPSRATPRPSSPSRATGAPSRSRATPRGR